MPTSAATPAEVELDLARTFKLLTYFAVLGVAAGVLFAMSASVSWREWLSMVGALLVVAGGCTMTSALVGFVFGIPRSLQDGKTDEGGYVNNTSLEQISDWLTKILVGVGLTELRQVPGALRDLASYVTANLGVKVPSAVAISLILFWLGYGFFFAYLLTRIRLRGILARADHAARGLLQSATAEKVEQAVDKLDLSGIDASDPLARVPSSVRADAAALAKIPIGEAQDTQALRRLGKANLAAGKFQDAATTFAKARKREPQDLDLVREEARALIFAKKYPEAVELVQAALECTTRLSDRRGLTELLMFALVYSPAPKGYEETIRVYEAAPRELLELSAAVHAYAACAYGQRFHFAQQQPGDYAAALAAAQKAVQMDQAWRPVLRAALEGGGVDDDLADFRVGDGYKELRALLGVAP